MKLQKEFKKFEENISVPSSKEDKLRTGRNSIRTKIKKEFKDKERLKPKFHMQGSFAMRTMIKEDESKYDIDDGVYIQGYEDKEQGEWPIPSTVHKWIYNAVENQTSIAPISKNTCIRVDYKDDYHIDLPIYILKEDKAYLAYKSKGWTFSDPKKFTNWFRDKNSDTDNQLRRLVKYLKQWRNHKNIDLKGIEITILVGDNFSKVKNNDLKSLAGTVTNIKLNLENNFVCYRPVEPTNEDLFKDISDTRKNSIVNGFDSLYNKLDDAIKKDSEQDASEIMVDIFGDKFPLAEDKQENKVSEAPFIVKRDNDEFA